jgi:hypothetical protein
MKVGHEGSRCVAERDVRSAAPDPNSKVVAERRKEARMIAGRNGWIAFRKGARLRECFVGDEGANGAQLTVNGAVNLPECFYLYFSSYFMWRRYCRVIWRSGDKVGVVFLL